MLGPLGDRNRRPLRLSYSEVALLAPTEAKPRFRSRLCSLCLCLKLDVLHLCSSSLQLSGHEKAQTSGFNARFISSTMSTSAPSPTEPPNISLDKRLPYISRADGFRDAVAPAYEYEALNLEKEEIRILILEPCAGDKNDRYNYVKFTFEVQPLASAEPFIAIKNGRGFRLLQEAVEIGDRSLLVATALEKFLRNIRKSGETVRLWVRYICVNQREPDEMSKQWTRDFVERIYARAESVIDMHATLDDLLDRGVIEKSVDSRYKEWKKNWDSGPKSYPLPKVYPTRLGKRPSNEQPFDDYEYVPLDAVAGEIRVIVIANDPDPGAPLILHLAHCPMGSDVAYHALSYTWGLETDCKQIIINGQKMWIRKNLEAALRSLRSPTHGLAIWADAICINQNDIDEKSRQVPRIGHVLDKAVVVICHVGEPDQHSDLALDFVKHLQGPMVRQDGDGQFMVGTPERIPPEELLRKCAALYLFLMRPYFRRTWITPEVAVASNPMIACGRRCDTRFEQLDSAAYNLQDMLLRDHELADKMKQAIPELEEVSEDRLRFIRKLFYFRHLHAGRPENSLLPVDISDTAPGYLETAILSRDFQATVPHDKIFALWHVARDKGDLKFHMDYAKSYEETFLEFAKAWAIYSGSLDIVGAAEYQRPPDEAVFYSRAPTWCPDWSTPSRSSSLIRREIFRRFKMAYQNDNDGPIYSADGGLRQEKEDRIYFEFVDSELHCLGIILDTVFATVTDSRDSSIEYKIGGLVPYTMKFCNDHNLTAYDDIAQAVVAMLHGDVPASWPKRQDNLANADEDNPDESYVCIPYKSRTNREQTPNASRHVPSYAGSYSRGEAWDAVCTVMRGRKAFVTAKGYLGLMPEYVEESISAEKVDSGLRVAILATCSVPVLLFERPDTPGVYKLLGTCFVQGWMEGEVLKEEMGCDTPREFWDAMIGSERLRIV